MRHNLSRPRSVVLHHVIVNISMWNVGHGGAGYGAAEKWKEATDLMQNNVSNPDETECTPRNEM